MRYVEVVVPVAQEDDVRETLEEYGVDHVATPEHSPDDGEGRLLFRFPLPPEAVEDVLGALHDAGVASGAYTVVVSAEAVTTPNFDALEAKYTEEGEADETVALAELRGSARKAMPSRRSYVFFTLLSTVIATIGLTVDSVLAVAGAMVVSPFVGATLSTAVGGVGGDRPLLANGLRSQGVGVLLAVAGAAATAWGLRALDVVSPSLSVANLGLVGSLLSPGLPSLLLALASGAAGALALATALPVALAGVAIAIALIPAAAAMGVGIAWGAPTAAVGAATLFAMNVVAVNAATLAVLGGLGYRPDWPRRRTDDASWSSSARRIVEVAVAAVLVLAFVVGAAVPTYEQIRLQHAVNEEVSATLQQPAYADVNVVGIELGYGGGPFTDGPTKVTVTVVRPPGARYPALASTLARRIDQRADRPVAVEVRFQTAARANASRPASKGTYRVVG